MSNRSATRRKPRRKRPVKGLWTRVHSRVDYVNPWFTVLKDRVIRPDGREGTYHVVKTRGAAVFTAALNARGEICLVRLFRYPTRRWSLEVPGGNSEGQDLLAAARREFMEETGYRAGRWTKLGSWQTVNGLSNEFSHAFLAEGLVYTGRHRRKEEGIAEVRFVPLDRAVRMIRKGRITDGQTLSTVFLAAMKRGILRLHGLETPNKSSLYSPRQNR